MVYGVIPTPPVPLSLSLESKREREREAAGPGSRLSSNFSEPWREKHKTKLRQQNPPGDMMGRASVAMVFLLPVGRPHPFCSREHAYRAMGDAPYCWRHANLVGVDVLPNNPPCYYLLEKNRHPGRRQPWPLPLHRPSVAVPLKRAR